MSMRSTVFLAVYSCCVVCLVAFLVLGTAFKIV